MARLLKALSNEDRLRILYCLAEGEQCVGDLERLLQIRQPTLSQQLARLRTDGLVRTRRDGKVIYYSLASPEAEGLIDVLYYLYCGPDDQVPPGRPSRAHLWARPVGAMGIETAGDRA